jgi:hypothetical protein
MPFDFSRMFRISIAKYLVRCQFNMSNSISSIPTLDPRASHSNCENDRCTRFYCAHVEGIVFKKGYRCIVFILLLQSFEFVTLFFAIGLRNSQELNFLSTVGMGVCWDRRIRIAKLFNLVIVYSGAIIDF